MSKSLRYLLFTLGIGTGLVALHPWVLAWKGDVMGVPVSLRALGNGLGVLMGILGLVLFFSKQAQTYLASWVHRLERLSKKEVFIFILSLTAFYAIGVISHKWKAHHSLGTHAHDLGFFSNICWNTSAGHWFYSSLFERNFMSIHVNWILWPLSFFYKFVESASVLLVAQAVFVALTIPFLWLAVQKVTGRLTLGFLASLLFVCSPYISHHVSNDFHPDAWQLPCLAAALWAWGRGNRPQILLFSCLALLAKEDVSFVLSGFGIFLMLKKEFRLTGFLLFLISVAVFLFNTIYFIPRFITGDTESLLFQRYYLLGGSFKEMGSNLFLNPSVYLKAFLYDPAKFWRLFCMVLPALGLVFFKPLFLIPPLISVAPHLMSQAQTQLHLADIYAIPTQPFIFLGAAYALKNKFIIRWIQGREWKAVGIALVVGALGIGASPRYYRYQPKERIQAFFELKDLVPAKASVLAQQNLLPHFDTRRYIQHFPPGWIYLQSSYYLNPDYVVMDRQGNTLPYTPEAFWEFMTQFEQSPRYEKVFEKEDFLLYQRKPPETLQMSTPKNHDFLF